MNGLGATGARLIAVAALLVSSAGCARLFGSYDIAPNGLATSEDRLRHMLATDQAATVFANFGESIEPPDDEVLRALYRGIIAFYAADFAESARVLDIAGTLADERYTKSISRSALSVVTNDRILPYEPGRTERLMIPYYAALARLRLGDAEGAAVEARRLSMLLQYHAGDDEAIEQSIEATLRYLAGAIFEANGDRNDADVAYRNAAALDSTLAFPSATSRGRGTVVVILEQGFVAHRVEHGLSVLVVPEEMDLIANGDGDERSAAITFLAARTLERITHAPYFAEGLYRPATFHVPGPVDRSLIPRRKPRTVCRTVQPETSAKDSVKAVPVGQNTTAKKECTKEKIEIDESPYLLRVAWPVYRTDSRMLDARLATAFDTIEFDGDADVSRGVVDDFRSERGLIVARTVARGAAKLALAKGAENSLEEKNETAARIVGLLGNLGSVLLERADTRSWHLLPAGISVARVHLQPGEHVLGVEVGGRSIDLGPVGVEAGEVTVVTARVW